MPARTLSVGSIRGSSIDKGVKYVSALDNAMCNGEWDENLSCDDCADDKAGLTLAARSEAKVATASNQQGASSSLAELVEAVPQLQRAISNAETIDEDRYIASVTLAKIYWLGKNHDAALKILPDHEPQHIANSNQPSCLGWLEVCSVKIPYMRISILTSLGQDQHVGDVFRKAVNTSTTTRSPELRKWTERLLAGVCLFYSENAFSEPSIYTVGEALRTFWAWNEFWNRSPTPTDRNRAQLLRIDVPRREVWKQYYDLLSLILQHGLVYSLKAKSATQLLVSAEEAMSEEQLLEARLNQWRELRRVQSTYETLLLSETKFPKATEDNTEVEEWVNKVIHNWKMLCGPRWSEAELGAGGKSAVGHGVLDILYRAATKTFHSTVILRELFNVHAALGEFDLAMHAFDSYVEIITKAKARAAKSGKHELGFDNDDLAVRTAADAIKLLCRYGDDVQAGKAIKIGESIQKWLAEQSPQGTDEVVTHADDNYASSKPAVPRPTEATLMTGTLAAAYRAIGQSKAQWARYTPATETRAALQQEAIKLFMQSELQDPESTETAYALALTYAETRDVTSAVATLRSILALHPVGPEEAEEAKDWTEQRQLLPLWHLLALCLSAKDQNDSAIKMCDAAFEQFGDDAVLFGQTATRISSETEKRASNGKPSRGVVDQMESLEKETIMQIKMSQLSFIELTEGPGAAAAASDELLGLFYRLFGPTEEGKTDITTGNTAATPQKHKSTLRSIAGSLRSRGNRDIKDAVVEKTTSLTSAPGYGLNSRSATPNQVNMDSPSITVTNEDGSGAGRFRKGRHALEHRFKRYGKRGSTISVDKMDLVHSSVRETPAYAAESNEELTALPPSRPVSQNRPISQHRPTSNGRAVQPAVAASTNGQPRQDLEVTHNGPHNQWPPPVGHDDQPPRQDIRLPAVHPAASNVPELRFPSLQQRRHKIGLLIEIWLFIAELYLRVDMLDDASGAIVEASKKAEALETEIADQGSSAREFASRRWGGAKSIDELMADIWSANGELATARSLPHKAMENHERALALFANHADSIIGLSEILMDIYEEKIPAEDSRPLLPPLELTSGSLIDIDGQVAAAETNAAFNPSAAVPQPRALDKDPSPADLNRFAARDRAYMLVSTLTRLGTGWDNPEAWCTLARAHELSKQISRAKQALWWVVELEDNKPLRHWKYANAGGFTL